MAHLIEIGADGTAAFVSANTPAWHRLGTVADGPMSVAEALQLAKLDNWDVRTVPVMALETSGKCAECEKALGEEHDDLCATGDHDGQDDTRIVDEHDTTAPIPAPMGVAVTRRNPFGGGREALSLAGLDYTPISNEVMGETLQTILDESDAIVDTAGSLRGGLETFITARLPEGIMVGGVDPVELNLAGLGYFHPGRSNEFLVTPVRVVCANTQYAALRNNVSRWAVRHSPNAPTRIAEAREALKLSFEYRDAFAEEAEKMIKATLSIANFEKVCREIWPKPDTDAQNRVKDRDDELMGTLKKVFRGDTNANIGKGKAGTHWSGYQTIVEYVDHHAPIQGNQDAALVRAERAMFSRGREVKGQAFQLFQLA